MSNTRSLQATHLCDDIQVDICRSQIQDAGGRYCFSSSVVVVLLTAMMSLLMVCTKQKLVISKALMPKFHTLAMRMSF